MNEIPVGLVLAFPDINSALIHCNGLRYPWDYTWMDLSLAGEDTPQANKLATLVGARIYKRYRILELAL